MGKNLFFWEEGLWQQQDTNPGAAASSVTNSGIFPLEMEPVRGGQPALPFPAWSWDWQSPQYLLSLSLNPSSAVTN